MYCSNCHFSCSDGAQLEDCNGIAVYFRPEDGLVYVDCRGVLHTARDVVSYHALNLYLWDGHANTVYINNMETVKYLFKYAFKGHDCMTLRSSVVPDANAPGAAGEVLDFDEFHAYM